MVFPITTEKLRTFGLIGHSNANGLNGVDQIFLGRTYLVPRKVPVFSPDELYWSNIYIFTSAHGHPGPSGTPSEHLISEGAWLEMTSNNPETPAAPHPHPSPYAYPNIVGFPHPNETYDIQEVSSPSYRGTGTMAGVEIPFLYLMSHHCADQIGMVKMAMPSSKFLRYDIGGQLGLAFGFYDWYTPADAFDWAPNTDRLYKKFIDKCIAARDAMPTGSVMSMDDVIVWMGDNDCLLTADRVANWEDDMRQFVKRLRKDLADNNISTLPADQIRIVLMKVHSAYDAIVDGQHAVMNAALDRVAAQDQFIRTVEVEDLERHTDDPAHYNAAGYLTASDRIYEAILEMEIEPYAALDTDDLLTVAQMKERVRLHYSRGSTQTDTRDDVLLLHLNGAMHHLVHQCGDMAYWRRQRMALDIRGGSTLQPITLPKFVHRLLEVEDPGDATYGLKFEMVGHADGGKLQIVMQEAVNGTYYVQFINTPRDLVKDTELVPVPKNLVEWLVAECCLRLSRAASNPVQNASWQAEVMRLQMDVLKNLSQTQRARKDRLHGPRRLPDVLRRRRRW